MFDVSEKYSNQLQFYAFLAYKFAIKNLILERFNGFISLALSVYLKMEVRT